MVLLVEDTESIRKLVKTILNRENIELYEASNGLEALSALSSNSYNFQLILMDIMMPEMDGIETTQAIREFSQIPIIFLTALSDERSQVLSYEAGADGYITKPFSKAIFLSMVKRYLSKRKEIKKFPHLELIESSKKVILDGVELSLATKENRLLFYLVENMGKVLTREQILNAIWGHDFFGTDRVVDNHIKKLRAKLGPCANYIKTVKLEGYLFEVTDEN